MRIYALYSLNKKILALTAVVFIAASTASAAVMGTVLSQITASAFRPLPDMIFCVPAGVSKHFFAFWVPMLAYESLLCGLALLRGFQAFQSLASPFRSGKYLVGILIRDSVLYFLVMFAAFLTDLLVWIMAPVHLIEIPIGFSVALSCVMGNRMILNVREMNKGLAEERSLSRRPSMLVSDTHVSSERILSAVEIAQLRSLRAGA